MKHLAQINLFDSQPYSGPGGYKLGSNPYDAATNFTSVLSVSIGLITLIAIIWFVFIFLTGALAIISSGGEKGANESARKKIASGVIGLIVTVTGILIVRLIGSLIGLDILNIGKMIQQLVIQ